MGASSSLAGATMNKEEEYAKDIWTTSSEDEPNDLDEYSESEWPYPTIYTYSVLDGDLAKRVQAITGNPGEVTIKTEVISGGWSEWTQENDYSGTIYCGGAYVVELVGSYDWTPLTYLLDWLEEAELNKKLAEQGDRIING